MDKQYIKVSDINGNYPHTCQYQSTLLEIKIRDAAAKQGTDIADRIKSFFKSCTGTDFNINTDSDRITIIYLENQPGTHYVIDGKHRLYITSPQIDMSVNETDGGYYISTTLYCHEFQNDPILFGIITPNPAGFPQ